MDLYELFSRCNHTELYQIARRAGHVVMPNLTSEALIKIIIEEELPPSTEHAVDDIRYAIMDFLIEHRKKLETQVACPAKSFQRDACFGCVDAQVFSCFVNNGSQNKRLIQLHLKKPSS